MLHGNLNNLSKSWLLETICESSPALKLAFKEDKVISIDFSDITNGKGFQSFIYLATVSYKDIAGRPEQFQCVLKVPTRVFNDHGVEQTNPEEKTAEFFFELVNSLHDQECLVYKFLGPLAGVGFPIPKVYKTISRNQAAKLSSENKSPVIVMEFIKGKTASIFETFTEPQLLNMAQDLAVLHDEVGQRADKTWEEGFDTRFRFHPEAAKMLTNGLEFFKADVPDSASYIDTLKKIDLHWFIRYSMKTLPEKFNAQTLAHGDAWSNNVIFEETSDGSTGDKVAAYIDWQMSFWGSQLQDLCQFLVICTDAEIREVVWEKVLLEYYQKLADLHARRNINVPFTFDEAKEMFQVLQVFFGINIALYYQLNTAVYNAENTEEGRRNKTKLKKRALEAIKNATRLVETLGLDDVSDNAEAEVGK
ncbi:unnamed protein product [Bursaphelenchus xylophilus]|uniref:(pine wood nematode) hypothetical protein n=1 Tax=Bursaphelenchus xylophilus TaxID=6326 RepID=A0A1I7SFM1_BURXY|nr:unnamed protein product [Bursaphelenchus xylophilus]CAG9112939.1 unnamed protein product [Bursaphelenchus xylophilus]